MEYVIDFEKLDENITSSEELSEENQITRYILEQLSESFRYSDKDVLNKISAKDLIKVYDTIYKADKILQDSSVEKNTSINLLKDMIKGEHLYEAISQAKEIEYDDCEVW